MTKTTLHVLYQHLHGRENVKHTVLTQQEPFIFNHCNIYLYATLPGSHFAPLARLSRIHSHKISRLELPTYTFFVGIIILTKIGSVWHLNWDSIYFTQYHTKKTPNNITWIISCLRFPAIYIHCLYRIVNYKSTQYHEYIYRITSKLSFNNAVEIIPYPRLPQIWLN